MSVPWSYTFVYNLRLNGEIGASYLNFYIVLVSISKKYTPSRTSPLSEAIFTRVF